MKRIIINEKQLKDISENSFSYLDDSNDKNYGGNRNITTNETTPNIDVEPLTTDELSNIIVPQSYYSYNYITPIISRVKNLYHSFYYNHVNNINEGNILINEDNKELNNITFRIPDKIYSILKQKKEKYNDKGIKGIKRLTFLLNNRNISFKELYRLREYFNNTDNKSVEYDIIGGSIMFRWVMKQIENSTKSVESSKKIKKQRGENNAYIKPHNKQRK